jgi:hypothetical protein
MTHVNRLLRFLASTMLATGASGQIAVAIGDVANGTGQAAEALTVGTLRAAGGIIKTVPVSAAGSLLMGAAAGTGVVAASLAVQALTISANAGIHVGKAGLAAAKDMSSGVAEAGWHTVFPQSRRTLEGRQARVGHACSSKVTNREMRRLLAGAEPRGRSECVSDLIVGNSARPD